MLPYVIAGIVGAALMGRTKPHSSISKVTCFGPRSGVTYQADRIDGLDVLVLTAPEGTRGVFEKDGAGGFRLVRALGSPEGIQQMRDDFEVDQKSEEGEAP